MSAWAMSSLLYGGGDHWLSETHNEGVLCCCPATLLMNEPVAQQDARDFST